MNTAELKGLPLDTRFEEYTIARFHADLLSKTVTSVALTQWYLDRIDAVD
ncbi:MAG: hypothetical protein JWM51_652, partial [Microbacteriaceae bacterium]|nr:hypothetical protein [Microbacteriaceae bacterium]